MLSLSFLSEYLNERTFVSLLGQVWILPFIAILWTFNESTNKWTQYLVLTILLSWPNPYPIQVAWCSGNSNTVRTRTVSAALYNMFVQASGIAAAYIYRDDDKPLCMQ